jgi:hypothetical protein
MTNTRIPKAIWTSRKLVAVLLFVLSPVCAYGEVSVSIERIEGFVLKVQSDGSFLIKDDQSGVHKVRETGLNVDPQIVAALIDGRRLSCRVEGRDGGIKMAECSIVFSIFSRRKIVKDLRFQRIKWLAEKISEEK